VVPARGVPGGTGRSLLTAWVVTFLCAQPAQHSVHATPLARRSTWARLFSVVLCHQLYRSRRQPAARVTVAFAGITLDDAGCPTIKQNTD